MLNRNKIKNEKKLKKLKKAMSLPINMIIVVAIGFVLLILAIAWIKNFFGGLTSQTKEMNEITKQAINSLVVEDPNAKFFLAKDKIQLKIGEVQAIGYYVQNFDNSDQSFYMAISCVSSTGDPNWNCDDNEKKKWFLQWLKTTTVKSASTYKDALIVNGPKGKNAGNYIFKIYVCKGSYNGNDIPDNCGSDEIYDHKTLIVEVS